MAENRIFSFMTGFSPFMALSYASSQNHSLTRGQRIGPVNPF
jgi:hypothetical protein